jgi:hypothetical protein
LTDINFFSLTVEEPNQFFKFLLKSEFIVDAMHISGYHKVTKNDAIRIGALLYRTKFGDSKADLQLVP